MKCELCGTEVKVVGHTTKHYEPVYKDLLHERDIYIEDLKNLILTHEKLRDKQNRVLRETIRMSRALNIAKAAIRKQMDYFVLQGESGAVAEYEYLRQTMQEIKSIEGDEK